MNKFTDTKDCGKCGGFLFKDFSDDPVIYCLQCGALAYVETPNNPKTTKNTRTNNPLNIYKNSVLVRVVETDVSKACGSCDSKNIKHIREEEKYGDELWVENFWRCACGWEDANWMQDAQSDYAAAA